MSAGTSVWPFKLFAGFFFLLAQASYLVLPTHYLFPEATLLPQLALTAPFYYMIGTAASVLTGLTIVVFNTGPGGVSRSSVAYGIAAALAMMALVRIIAVAYDAESFGLWADLFVPEIPALLIAALAFLRIGMGSWELGSRLMGVWRSIRAVPLWVQFWVWGPLVVVNMAPFFFIGHPLGLAATMATLYILFSNMPILLIERGVSRALSIPHIFPWIPVLAYFALVLTGRVDGVAVEPGTAIYYFAWTYLAVNGISMAFDLLDSARWLFGDRQIAQAGAAA